MSGTKAGGLKARDIDLRKQGEDFYKNIGRKGGQNGHTGGFAANPELARTAGRKGGLKSRRGRAKKPQENPAPESMSESEGKTEQKGGNSEQKRDSQ